MVEERDLRILKKSIEMFNDFSIKVESINSASEFISIHNRNIETIYKIAIERNSDYIKNKLNEYPKISTKEVSIYIRTRKKEVSILSILLTSIAYFIIDKMVTMINTKGSTKEMIKLKVLQIQKINNEVLNVIENPYLEEVYKVINSQ